MREVLWQLDGVGLSSRLADVSVSICSGVTAVMGPSGSGKTSLLNLLVGYEEATSGSVSSDQHLKNGQASNIFWSPQHHGLWPHMTARQHLAAVCDEADKVEALLAAFDLSECSDAKPGELSKGQCGRLSIARALLSDASVLVFDEPLAHVDAARVGKYWQVISEHLGNRSLVFATHDAGTVLAEAQRVIYLRRGRVQYEGEVRSFYDNPDQAELADAFGPSNWFESDETTTWLGVTSDGARCVRPERLAVEADETSAMKVVDTRLRGQMTETVIARDGQQRRHHDRLACSLVSMFDGQCHVVRFQNLFTKPREEMNRVVDGDS